MDSVGGGNACGTFRHNDAAEFFGLKPIIRVIIIDQFLDKQARTHLQRTKSVHASELELGDGGALGVNSLLWT